MIAIGGAIGTGLIVGTGSALTWVSLLKQLSKSPR
jgi:L-asparagine transporter-like permease